jgi:hypothetical protein
VGLVSLRFLATCCLLFVSLPVFAGEKNCERVKYRAPSSAEIAIEFVFDTSYPYGQYANGDWWVSAGTGGYVRIISILPEARDGLNGFEVNPSSRSKQGFDRRVAGYD